MIKILVSACLLGENCKWNGRNNAREQIIALQDKYELVPFCSEVMSGMPVPRIPCEIRDNKVYNQVELEVTKYFILGAKKALEVAKSNSCHYAILKDHSPSCGVNKIYDGTFSLKLIQGQGFTTRLLEKNNIKVYADSEVNRLLSDLEALK
jgi:uncharacterized protein YbbK (DUF523 family)